MIKPEDKILIVVPHDDDATLSFGGLIHKYRENQIKICVFCLGGPASNTSRAIRLQELNNAIKVLSENAEVIPNEGQLDGLLSTVPESELVRKIDKLIKTYEPDVVLCGAKSEHTDHQALYKAFRGAARLKEGRMPRIFGIGTYPFSEQLYMEREGGKVFITLSDDDIQAKLDAWKEHKSQQKAAPSPLSVDGVTIQSKYYGVNCGYKNAELIYLLREID